MLYSAVSRGKFQVAEQLKIKLGQGGRGGSWKVLPKTPFFSWCGQFLAFFRRNGLMQRSSKRGKQFNFPFVTWWLCWCPFSWPHAIVELFSNLWGGEPFHFRSPLCLAVSKVTKIPAHMRTNISTWSHLFLCTVFSSQGSPTNLLFKAPLWEPD